MTVVQFCLVFISRPLDIEPEKSYAQCCKPLRASVLIVTISRHNKTSCLGNLPLLCHLCSCLCEKSSNSFYYQFLLIIFPFHLNADNQKLIHHIYMIFAWNVPNSSQSSVQIPSGDATHTTHGKQLYLGRKIIDNLYSWK